MLDRLGLTKIETPSYRGHRFRHEIISHAGWFYYRFCLSSSMWRISWLSPNRPTFDHCRSRLDRSQVDNAADGTLPERSR